MKVIHDLPKEVIDTFLKLGIIADEPDARYYNLPQWFRKDDDGLISEVPFKELPDSVKHIHLSFRDYQRVFSLQEILTYGAVCAVKGRDMNPVDYFREKLNVDITQEEK